MGTTWKVVVTEPSPFGKECVNGVQLSVAREGPLGGAGGLEGGLVDAGGLTATGVKVVLAELGLAIGVGGGWAGSGACGVFEGALFGPGSAIAWEVTAPLARVAAAVIRMISLRQVA